MNDYSQQLDENLPVSTSVLLLECRANSPESTLAVEQLASTALSLRQRPLPV